ncbi:hypothetical protein O7635_03565 [Asanoa sp. WMMD1127]|uniref:hypothetical protein n=1 Tax=Asanoa sp. WMMD1127 TaxID=3016107 RepID=UPI002417A0ED|nr:hypothetical protein [Asanoa sp. WMMD1127]MDG4820930.1 hypothetical protein [Asanoa sp. WMMD1127]
MPEVYLDFAAAARAAQDLAAIGAQVRAAESISACAPWGADEAGQAFARVYLPVAAAALSARSAAGDALSELGSAVAAACASTSSADDAAARRFGPSP